MFGQVFVWFTPQALGIDPDAFSNVRHHSDLQPLLDGCKVKRMDATETLFKSDLAKRDGNSVLARLDLGIDPRTMDFRFAQRLAEVETEMVEVHCWVYVTANFQKRVTLGYWVDTQNASNYASVTYDPDKEGRHRIYLVITTRTLARARDLLLQGLRGEIRPKELIAI